MRAPRRRLRCGARTRKPGAPPCQRWALAGKARCRLHGGKSTGARTPEGLAKVRGQNLRLGFDATPEPHVGPEGAAFLQRLASLPLDTPRDRIVYGRMLLAFLVTSEAALGIKLLGPCLDAVNLIADSTLEAAREGYFQTEPLTLTLRFVNAAGEEIPASELAARARDQD